MIDLTGTPQEPETVTVSQAWVVRIYRWLDPQSCTPNMLCTCTLEEYEHGRCKDGCSRFMKP